MQREFGGYLPLELPHGQELYTGAGVLRLKLWPQCDLWLPCATRAQKKGVSALLQLQHGL